MRPRHKAAENAQAHPPPARTVRPASMRPRHKAAENLDRGVVAQAVLLTKLQ